EFEFEKSIPPGTAKPFFGNLEVPKDFDQETQLAIASPTPEASVPARPTELVPTTDTSLAVPKTEEPPPATRYASHIASESPTTEPVSKTLSRESETDNGNHKARPSFEASTGNYTIFVSTHASLVSAQRDVERFKSQGYEAQIERSYSPSDGLTWYRVYIGRFSSRDQALAYAQQIAGVIGQSYWVGTVASEVEEPVPSSDYASRGASESPTTEPVSNTSYESSTGDYTIFVSTHASLVSAQRDVEHLKAQGYEAQIYRFYSASDAMNWYRVYVGRFPNRDEALGYAQQHAGVIGKGYWVGVLR
ncbi:MAG: SPOR domain-containing protein, partial [candidate division KSB1 bacterium]|nr:SPOR domain-containing protein [candidate division KSB1 bacterium]